VNVQLKNHLIEASVADTGRGFSPALLKEIQTSSGFAGGVGISGMHERIGYIGGKLEIRSDKNGTTVTALVPIDYQPASPDQMFQLGSTTATPSRTPMETSQSE
jgi:signal transduction histidine kinase